MRALRLFALTGYTHPADRDRAQRAGFDGFATLAYLTSLFHLPLANATAINMATPLFITLFAVIAFRENASGNGYEPMPMTQRDRRLTVDDVLHRIANQINDLSTDPS